ncbi:MAG: hypothetical protein QX190_10340 [Methylococcales bacterium]
MKNPPVQFTNLIQEHPQLTEQVARMEIAECGAFRDDVTFPRVPLRSTRATKLYRLP